MPRNKLCVDLIGTYFIRRQVKKEDLNLTAIIMIGPDTRWFGITQYNNKRSISIANLVETDWLTRYPQPTEITYEHVSEFIGDGFRASII